jgi:hypothetical protein
MSGFVDLSVPLLVLSGPVRALMAPMAMRDDSYANQRLDLCCGQNYFALDFSAVLESGTKSSKRKEANETRLALFFPSCSALVQQLVVLSLFIGLAILFLLARGSSVKGVEQPKGPPHGLQFRFILYLARFFEKL